MAQTSLTPSKAAYRLTHILNTVAQAHSVDRFPVDVTQLALSAAELFHWNDPIAQVSAANINRFEGALYPDEDRGRWLLLFNDCLRSEGRIRFTQAHELGHYILHRFDRDQFECSSQDMIDLARDERDVESQADSFASALLMPLDDFRHTIGSACDFDMLGSCAERYGVSLTAATLRWLEHTEHAAILAVHRDGFLDWAYSSKAAMRAGAFFRTKGRPVPVPEGTLAADERIAADRSGTEVSAQCWFPYALPDLSLREHKVRADHYDFTMTLLVLPKSSNVWKPRDYE